MALLTVRELRAMKDGDRLSESAGRGQGTLRFRKAGGRIRIYFRSTRPDGTRDELPIGWYDEAGRDGWTLLQVRDEAAKVREQLQTGSGDVRADQDAEKAAREAERKALDLAREQAERKAVEREQYTLSALCGAYVRMLEERGKAKSAKDTESSFRIHVLTAHPEIASLPANEVTSHQIAAIVRAARETGATRVPGILRNYLHAAFAAAVRAPFDSTLPAELIAFNVEVNPVSAVPSVPVTAGNRALSREELRVYMGYLGQGLADQALLLALLAGGQRTTQLLRAKLGDWDGAVLRLWDGKGKRLKPREHLLPLGPMGAALVDALAGRARDRADAGGLNPSLFGSRDRKGAAAVMHYTTCSDRVSEIAATMACEPFNLRDIRRTVETQLAGLGISRDVRAQLLSHGISGVQAVHYDRHGYMGEKRAALLAWERHLTQLQDGESGSNVVRLEQRSA